MIVFCVHDARAAERRTPTKMTTLIQQADDAWATAFNTGNTAAIEAMYTENATALPPGHDMVTGRAAIADFWGGVIKSGVKNIALKVMSVDRYGRIAREIGRFSFDGPNGRTEGKYVVFWKQVQDQWMLDTDIWNLDK